MDIEDIEGAVSDTPRVSSSKRVQAAARASETGETTEIPRCLPGSYLIYVKTWGCSHNVSDGEYMAGLLSAYGYRVTTDESKRTDADLWLLNSCTVKGPSQDHFLTATRRAQAAGKKLVVAGCVPQGDKGIANGFSVVGVQQIDRVVEVVEETLLGHTVQLYSQKTREDETGRRRKRKDGGAKLTLPKIRKNPLVEICPINTGCLNTCTYCKTKHARGDLGSYAIEEIVGRLREVRKEGIKEVWLTSEDTGAYGLDIGTHIGELLTAVCQVLDEEESRGLMVRIGMTNPPYIMEHMQLVAEVLRHPHVYGFLHIPVQSASDEVLDDMKRKYHCEEFTKLCDYLLQNVPRIHLATDVICGFPTESEEDFDKTYQLVDDYRFPTLNISQFYPRPGTAAARMKKLDTKIVKQRSRRVSALWKSYTCFEDRVRETHRVLVTERAADGHHFVGHNKCYDHFLVPPLTGVQLLGQCVDVCITEVGKFHLASRLTETCREKLVAGTWNVDGCMLPTDGIDSLKRMPKPKQNDSRLFFAMLVTVGVLISVLIQVLRGTLQVPKLF